MRTTWGRLRVVRKQKARVRGKLGLRLLLGVQRKSKAKLRQQFSAGYFALIVAPSSGMLPSCLVPCSGIIKTEALPSGVQGLIGPEEVQLWVVSLHIKGSRRGSLSPARKVFKMPKTS